MVLTSVCQHFLYEKEDSNLKQRKICASVYKFCVTISFELPDKTVFVRDVIFKRPFSLTYGSVASDTAVCVGSARTGLARIGDDLDRCLAS